MGASFSWVAFQGVSKDEVLEGLGLGDTGEEVEEGDEVDTPFAGTEIPDGWYLVQSNDSLYPLDLDLESLSRDCRVLAVRSYETVMDSGASFYENGTILWELSHSSDGGQDDLTVSGSPPPAFDAIRDEAQADYDECVKEGTVFDCFFDVPLDTAAALCDYRYDRVDFDWGSPDFTRLEETGEAAPETPHREKPETLDSEPPSLKSPKRTPAEPQKPRTFWQKLFGG